MARKFRASSRARPQRGSYEVRARYESSHDREVEGVKAWRGELESAPVSLEIK